MSYLSLPSQNFSWDLWNLWPLLIVLSISLTSSLVSSNFQNEKWHPLLRVICSLTFHVLRRGRYALFSPILQKGSLFLSSSVEFQAIRLHCPALSCLVLYSLIFEIFCNWLTVFPLHLSSITIIGDISVYLLVYQYSVIFVLTFYLLLLDTHFHFHVGSQVLLPSSLRKYNLWTDMKN